MKIFMVQTAFVLVLFASSISFGYNISEYCKTVSDSVGGSNKIEEICREIEQKAKSNILDINIPTKIIKHCEKVSEDVGGGYQIMEICIQEELAAELRKG